MRKKGIQIGRVIEYSIPHMKAYEIYKNEDCPNALKCASSIINLPNYPGISNSELEIVVNAIREYFARNGK